MQRCTCMYILWPGEQELSYKSPLLLFVPLSGDQEKNFMGTGWKWLSLGSPEMFT